MARPEIGELVEIYSAGVKKSVLEVLADRPSETIEELLVMVEEHMEAPDKHGLRAVWDAAGVTDGRGGVMPRKTKVLEDVIGYAEVAEKMGVKVKSVIAFRSRDPEFPAPITPASFRSPGWDPADIDRYITLREVRSSGRSGRPPRSASGDRLDVDPAMNDRIRDLIQAKATVKSIADLIGVTPAAIWLRLNGRTRWARAELVAIANKLEVPLEQLLEGAPAKKPTRRSTPAK
jgi:predicted DNA-binding transcriptional regulator AlpA